jgi:phage FluMu protein Com
MKENKTATETASEDLAHRSLVRGRVMITGRGQYIEVRCPFCQNSHWHRWREEEAFPLHRTAPCMMRNYIIECLDE